MRKNNKLKLIAIVFVFLFYAFLNVQGTNAIYRDKFSTNVYLTIQSNTLTVNFNSDGTIIRTVTREYGDPVGELPETSKSGYRFMGWYTEETGGEEIDETTPVLSDTTFYARFLQIVCKKASTLHTQTCHRNDGKGCNISINSNNDRLFANGAEITYGSLTSDYGVLPGDAYDCDVNDDGTFDPTTERFYFLRKNGDNATLIHSTNFLEDGQVLETSSSNDIYVYDLVPSILPDSTVWTNETLIKTDGLPSRIGTHEDITAACGGTDLKKCYYLLENTKFIGETYGRSGIWLVQEGTTEYRLMSTTVDLVHGDYDKNSVRPVIDIPFDSLENNKLREKHTVTFNSMGGSSVPSITDYDGTKLGTLATPLKQGSSFIGWFTEEEGGTQINENTVITKNITYYAHYNEIATVTFNPNGGTTTEPTREVHVGNAVGELPTATRGVDEFEGWYTEETGGTKITSSTVIEGNVEFFAHYREKVVVTFNVNGGENLSFASKEVFTDDPVGELPTATKGTDTFVGWYTDDTFTTEVTEETIVTEATEYIALWAEDDIVAIVNGEEKTSIQDAINLVPTTGVKTVIKVIKDVAINQKEAYLRVSNGQNILFDVGDHTISSTTTNIMRNHGTVEFINGTFIVTADQGVINNESGGVMTISGGTFRCEGKRQGIYNDSGTLTITGDANISNRTGDRGAVENVNNGKLYITGGTITADGGTAVVNGGLNVSTTGTVVIGSNDGHISTTTPVIKGAKYGLDSKAAASATTVYDGIFKGKTSAIHDENNITINETVSIEHGTEGTYKTAYLVDSEVATVTFDAKDGTSSEASRSVVIGTAIGELPTATPANSIYSFDGWYTEANGGEKITSETIVNESITYYAHYSYESSDEIVEHNILPAAIKTYLSSQSSWANGQTDNNHSSFEAAMRNNLNTNNCVYFENYDKRDVEAGGSVYCDQPNPYDTHMTGTVKVYKSSATRTKGAEATYVTVNNGKIYNMIPGEYYKWELSTDSSVYGYIHATGERRIISIDNATNIDKIRNVRDFGGIKVDKNGDGTIDGTIKYGILYRGEAIIGNDSAKYFTKLGIQNEMDLRKAADHGSNNESALPNLVTDSSGKTFEIKHYAIDKENYSGYYDMSRAALTRVMQEVVNGGNDYALYIHCRIGADRTGTLAYLIEGILGAPEEERYKDYELTYYYGFTDRTRFYSIKPGGETPNDKKFKYLREIMTVGGKEDVYAWYMKGSTDQDADDALITAFKNKMIEAL